MALIRPNPVWLALAVLAGTPVVCLAAAQEIVSRQLPIDVNAASSDVDYKTHTVVFRDIVISQGKTKVQAEHAHATGLDFDNSRWTFEGNVRIDAEPRGNLRSDQAVVEFRNNQLAKATATGKPAQFEQKREDSDLSARGHADQIVYDVADGTVRLSNNAWLANGPNQISGALLVYNIRDEKLEAGGVAEPQSPVLPAGATQGADGRVHLTIDPKTNVVTGKPQGQQPAKSDGTHGDSSRSNATPQQQSEPTRPDPNKPQ